MSEIADGLNLTAPTVSVGVRRLEEVGLLERQPNGIASSSRIITIGSPLLVAVQRLHWFAMVGWGVVTVGVLLRPSEWIRFVGLVSRVVELVVGIPLTIATAINLGRFSMFAAAPIFSLGLVVVFVWPFWWRWFTGSPAEKLSRSVVGTPSTQVA